MIFDELGMDTISFNVLDPGGGGMARDLAPTPEQVQYCRQVISDHKSSYPISNSTRFLSQLGNFEYRCNPWKCVQINSGGFLLSPCLFSSENPDLFPDGRTTDLSENTLSDAWREAQKIYSRYADCKLCNLGCVIESAWSTYDLDFIINDSFRGTMVPTMKRVRERNAGSHHR
jgi:hypothetical protein